MLKTLTALATVATIAAGTLVTSAPAEARGGRIAAGIIGGVAAGAILGGALAGPRYYQEPYAAYPYRARCHWERQRTWEGYVQRVRVCY